ncbi:hypothetical protein [Streptomyces sp. NPDC052114]|uniref:hypothetical protein n=1 Tax=unclassified Streptomyces TaxID=2593676 RepID=UPI00341C4C3E
MSPVIQEHAEDLAHDDVFDLDVDIRLSESGPDSAFPTTSCTSSCQTVINPLTCVTC